MWAFRLLLTWPWSSLSSSLPHNVIAGFYQDWASQGRERGWAKAHKTETTLFLEPKLKVVSYYFFCILFAKSDSLRPACPQLNGNWAPLLKGRIVKGYMDISLKSQRYITFTLQFKKSTSKIYFKDTLAKKKRQINMVKRLFITIMFLVSKDSS